jgi:hypothetical protein
VTSIAGLAYSLRNIKMDRVSLLMVPVAYTGDGKVRLLQSKNNDLGATADEVFEALAADQPVPGTTAYKTLHPEPTDDAGTQEAAPPTGGATPETPAGETPGADPSPNKGVTTALNAPTTCE